MIVGNSLLSELRNLAGINGPLALVTDSNAGPLYAAACADAAAIITMPAGERHKTLATVQMIYEELLTAGLDRAGTIVALGGGVVGDVAGFAAATFMRGVDFVQCPTSLLAMVDASIGGKTGVDLPQGKNLVGAFKQPQAVVADLSTLRTLPAEELAAGMAEVVKHGLIADPEIIAGLERDELDWLTAEKCTSPEFHALVTRAIHVKREVVQDDPYEQGRRATLNLGHTFGHAIERVTHYGIRHGEAVAIGLATAAHLSVRLGHCPSSLRPRIETILHRLRLPVRIPVGLSAEALMAAMTHDKKKAAGRLRLVLIREVGDVFVTADVPHEALRETLIALGADE